MNPLIKLALPLGLGVAAAGMNWVALHKGPPPRAFGVAVADIKAGDVLKESHFGKVMVGGETSTALPRTAIPFEQLDTIYGREATRDVRKGDLVLWQDSTRPGWELAVQADEKALPISLDGLSSVPTLIRVGDQIGFLVARDRGPAPRSDSPAVRQQQRPEDVDLDYVGPFRVLSVGDRISRDNAEKGPGRGADERVITVAVKTGAEGQLDNKTRRLITARYADKNGLKIVGIIFDSARKQETAALPPG